MNARATGMLKEYGFKIDSRTLVKRLSAADRQLVEITRATVEANRVLVMDEPTSSLTAHEVADLFRLIRELKNRGLAIMYISHRLEERDFIADRLTVLRDGRAAYAGVWGEISRAEIIRHMAGRELKEIFPPRALAKGDVRLRIANLTRAGKFRDVSFEVRAGEVIGIAGLAGAGRTELVETIFGAYPADAGEIVLNGARLQMAQPDLTVTQGLVRLPEDRKRTGFSLN